METPSSISGPENVVNDLVRQLPVRAEITPEWNARAMEMLQARLQQQNAQMQTMFANDRKAQLALGQQLLANQQAQYDAGVERNNTTNEAMHQSMQGSIKHVGDVNSYRDPSTGQTYRVSNQYSHTYLDSMGKTILQTNSASSPGPETIWQELQPQH